MRQIWIPRIGNPDVLEIREAPDPNPGQGQVRIRVDAAGVNFADIMARVGLYPDAPKLPAVVGYEVSGEIDAVGKGVEGFREGRHVFALTRFGGYSDRVVVPANQVFPVPANMKTGDAAAIPVNYLTAWLMLVYLGGVREGETVLVHAAAGGVGLAAVQICKWRGARVFGTASVGKHERLREMGVAECIDYHTQDFEREVMTRTGGRGVDIVLDAVGGASAKKGYRILAPLGRLFQFGASSMSTGKTRSILSALKGVVSMPIFFPIKLMNENRTVSGVNLGHLWDEVDKLRGMAEEMAPLFDDGTLRPVVDRKFSFAEASAAHAYIQDHKNFGKVLLVP
ncbi:medium chain dehydrogenase/reductase family protein [bacterium]|nr:medium chain dehydrogenase/reductase family protein [bacterium]